MTITKTTRQLKNYVRKLRITDNSIIMIRSSGPDDQDALELARSLGKALEETALKHIVVMLVDDFDRIESLDMSVMNRHGWFRREQISNLFKKIETGDRKDEKR